MDQADDCRRSAQAYCALETAAIRLHAGQPLFWPIGEMEEENRRYRQNLIDALLYALDLICQSGLSVEKTEPLERVRRAYTSK